MQSDTNGLDGALPRGPLTAHVATYERLITPARRPAVIDCNCVRRAEPPNSRGRSWPVCPVQRLLTVATRRCNLCSGLGPALSIAGSRLLANGHRLDGDRR